MGIKLLYNDNFRNVEVVLSLIVAIQENEHTFT